METVRNGDRESRVREREDRHWEGGECEGKGNLLRKPNRCFLKKIYNNGL